MSDSDAWRADKTLSDWNEFTRDWPEIGSDEFRRYRVREGLEEIVAQTKDLMDIPYGSGDGEFRHTPAILQRITRDNDSGLSDLLSAHERAAAGLEWLARRALIPAEMCLVDALRDQVQGYRKALGRRDPHPSGAPGRPAETERDCRLATAYDEQLAAGNRGRAVARQSG